MSTDDRRHISDHINPAVEDALFELADAKGVDISRLLANMFTLEDLLPEPGGSLHPTPPGCVRLNIYITEVNAAHAKRIAREHHTNVTSVVDTALTELAKRM